MAKFAERTTVPVNTTRAEIEKTLIRFGASKFMVMVDGDAFKATVQFFARERWIRLTLQLPDPKVERNCAAEERRRWRSLAALVKAKLVAVDDGLVEFEEEFLPHVLMSDGMTVYERTHQALALEYQSGKPQTLLLAN